MKNRGLATRSRGDKLREGIERTVIEEISCSALKISAGGRTYGFVVKLAESVEYFGDHGRPSCDVFGLRVSLEFCVVLQNTQAEAAGAQKVRQGGDMTRMGGGVTYGSNRSATCGRAAWCSCRGS